MRKSKEETAQTRKRIIEIAAKAFRSNGIHATGVAETMAAVGMSHGGFYRHFSSKEELRSGPDGDPEARDSAIFTLTSMIGPVTMARVVDDLGLSLRILGVAKRRLARPHKRLGSGA